MWGLVSAGQATVTHHNGSSETTRAAAGFHVVDNHRLQGHLGRVTNLEKEVPSDARSALLQGAQRLLVEQGQGGLTTRRVAAAAGVQHGLVHYYFGSMDELVLQVLEQFTSQLVARQRAMYAQPVPFADKWELAMGFLQEDDDSNGYHKVVLELQALAWNRPQLRERLVAVNAAWREVLLQAFAEAQDVGELDLHGWPLEAFVALVMTANQGVTLERQIGVRDGHAALLAAVTTTITPRAEGLR
jgi:AcrR family transcriptional regulator